jgi:phosphomannomutase
MSSIETLMIGVSGMRGTVGATLTPDAVSRLAAAFAAYMKRTSQPTDGKAFKVVFGRDGRPSGTWVRDAAVAALTASGIAVVDLDIVTTPGVAMMVKHLKADAGVVCTASHNPIQWNGLKLLNRDAVAPPPAEAQKIIEMFHAGVSDFVRVEHIIAPTKDGSTHALHVDKVCAHVDVLGIAAKRFRVVLDSVNGAGSVATAMLLSKLGCSLVHLHGTPNGQFPHNPEPTAENLVQLTQEVRNHRAAVGFAQDPDADRLAVVDELGTYIGEEYSLALAADFILSKKKGGSAVTNLSTSRMLDDIAVKHGGKVIRTPVGEANVIDAITKHNAVIGGEGNGGVIDPRIVGGRDSLVGIAYVLQLMAQAGKPLSQIVAGIPSYKIVKTKFDCRREDANRAVQAIVAEAGSSGGVVDLQDGIRIDWPEERSWVHARPSNTEPIMRIIAEAPDAAIAEKRIDMVQKTVRKVLG